MDDPYTKFAFALSDHLRSITKGDGGREFADKTKRKMAEALREMFEGQRS